MDNKNYLGQLMEYINNHMPEGVEVQMLGALNNYGSVVFSLWLNYNNFANAHEEFDRIPNANNIFKDIDEEKSFIDGWKKRSLEKYKETVKEHTRKYFEEKSELPKYINYHTPEITYDVLTAGDTPVSNETEKRIIEKINKRNQEVLKSFTDNCMPNYSHRYEEISISADDVKHILDKATRYNGTITMPEESVFDLIVNADEYFSNIGDLDLFFSGLTDSIVEYIERQEFMEEIKNGTKTTEGILST